MFSYGSFKLFFLKISLGVVFLVFSGFLITSLLTNNPNDPGIGKLRDSLEIYNYFGYWGAISSNILLVFLGSLSIIIVLFVFYTGLVFLVGFKSKFIFVKFFLVIISVIFLNFSIKSSGFNLVETGIISEFFLQILYYNFPNLINQPLYKYLVSGFLGVMSIFVLIYSFSIKINFLKIIISRFLGFVFFAFLKPFKSFLSFDKKEPYSFIKSTKIKSEPTIGKKSNTFINTKNKLSAEGNINKKDSEFIFNLPDVEFLIKSNTKGSDRREIENLNKTNAKNLEKILSEYGVDGNVTGYKTGPIVTLYEFVPEAGIKASKIIGLSDDIARAMSAVSTRISSQPGKTSLGIEIPNQKRENVMFGDLIESSKFKELNNCLTLALGKDISGQLVFADLEKMPHLLIAGTTGSGKSVGINTMILSLLI